MKSYSLLIFTACIYIIDAAGSKCGTSFNRDIKDSTNKYRRMNGAKVLTEDPALVSSAQKWADDLCKRKTSEHSKRKGVGENLYGFSVKPKPSSTPKLGAAAARAFYSECQCQKNENKFNPKTGHFTQIVWKSSTKMGCGCCGYAAAGGWYKYVVVCHYKSAGNVQGQYKTNVGAASKGYCGKTGLDKIQC